MKTEDIVAILKHGEGQRTEFKKSFSETNEAIRSLGAFANQDGGTVILGSDDEGKAIGVDIGHNTIENFANSITRDTDPSLAPTIEEFEIAGHKIVAVTIERIGDGQVAYAFGSAKIRVGKTNQQMAPDLQRSRLQSRAEKWSEQHDTPRYKVTQLGVSRLETAFEPSLKIAHIAGDPVATLEWRFRGPRFQGDWNVADGFSLERTNVSGVFDLTELPIDDEHVEQDQMGIEIRFYWRDQWRHEIHRWPITRREFPTKVLWDIGRQLIPTLYIEPDSQSSSKVINSDTKDLIEAVRRFGNHARQVIKTVSDVMRPSTANPSLGSYANLGSSNVDTQALDIQNLAVNQYKRLKEEVGIAVDRSPKDYRTLIDKYLDSMSKLSFPDLIPADLQAAYDRAEKLTDNVIIALKEATNEKNGF